MSARSAVSASLGSTSAPFSAQRLRGGYSLAGGGVAARLSTAGAQLRDGAGGVAFRLDALGRSGALHTPGRVASLAARANRVELRRSGAAEWYEAGPLGIEQGFSLTKRPAGSGPVELEIGLGGSLRAVRDGSGIAFLNADGQTALRYGGLTATDALGHRLPATLALQHGLLTIRVQDAGARYPVRIDPLVQQGTKLAPGAGDTPTQGWQGYSVALSADGNTAFVGGIGEASGAGGVWVFTRSGGIWTQDGPKLEPTTERPVPVRAEHRALRGRDNRTDRRPGGQRRRRRGLGLRRRQWLLDTARIEAHAERREGGRRRSAERRASRRTGTPR